MGKWILFLTSALHRVPVLVLLQVFGWECGINDMDWQGRDFKIPQSVPYRIGLNWAHSNQEAACVLDQYSLSSKVATCEGSSFYICTELPAECHCPWRKNWGMYLSIYPWAYGSFFLLLSSMLFSLAHALCSISVNVDWAGSLSGVPCPLFRPVSLLQARWIHFIWCWCTIGCHGIWKWQGKQLLVGACDGHWNEKNAWDYSNRGGSNDGIPTQSHQLAYYWS